MDHPPRAYSPAQQIIGLLVALGVTSIAAAAGAVASSTAPTFYASLTRPAWAPPAWVFGPVWTVLYLLMGIAAWLVWRKRTARRRPALTLYAIQLFFNAVWSWVFFRAHLGELSIINILLLWVLIVWLIFLFRKISLASAVLLIPYLLWVSFAAALNIMIWRLNPGLL